VKQENIYSKPPYNGTASDRKYSCCWKVPLIHVLSFDQVFRQRQPRFRLGQVSLYSNFGFVTTLRAARPLFREGVCRSCISWRTEKIFLTSFFFSTRSV